MKSNVVNIEVTGIEHAVRLHGGQRRLARSIGVTQQVVGEWVRQGYVPNGRVAIISELTGVERRRLINPKVLEIIEG